ncbi:MAG: type II secretion system protein [Candidatus Paceibacterota bacterium]
MERDKNQFPNFQILFAKVVFIKKLLKFPPSADPHKAENIMQKNKGFTLIELLVVIAIIGILAAIVLSSLGDARNKGKDGAVKGQMDQIKKQSELYYYSQSPTNIYSGLCTATVVNKGLGGATGPGLLKSIADASGVDGGAGAPVTSNITAGTYNKVTCHAVGGTTTAYAVEAPLSDSTSAIPKMFCVDSTGKAIITSVPISASEYDCD